MFTYNGVSCDTFEELEQLFAEIDRLLDCGNFERAESLLSQMEHTLHIPHGTGELDTLEIVAGAQRRARKPL